MLSCFFFPSFFVARGRLEGNAQQLDFTSRPTDSAPSSPRALSSAHQPQPAPRIRPSGRDFLEKGQKGTLGLLLQLDGLSLGGGLPAKSKHSCAEVQKGGEAERCLSPIGFVSWLCPKLVPAWWLPQALCQNGRGTS